MERLEFTENYELLEEIPDYGFSGRMDLKEIYIPKSVRKIGKYAFYNCRDLKKITFYSSLVDIGSGAFTGCHHIRELDITMLNDHYACLKEIVQELTEELTVQIRGKEEAKLVFPEYFEEGIENTPARLINHQVHGSGMKYRNCLYKKEIKYAEYDACFSWAKDIENPETIQKMVLARLRYPIQLQALAKKAYETYAREYLVDMGKKLVRENDVEGLVWILEKYVESNAQIEDILEEASKKEAVECVSVLMDLRKDRFVKGKTRGIPDFDFDF